MTCLPFRRLLRPVKDAESDDPADLPSLEQQVHLPMITVELPSLTCESPVSIDQPLSLFDARMDPISPLLLLEPDVTPMLLRIDDGCTRCFCKQDTQVAHTE